MNTMRLTSLFVSLLIIGIAPTALAQDVPDAPADEDDAADADTPDTPDTPDVPDAPEAEPRVDDPAAAPEPATAGPGTLRLHVISTRNTYVKLDVDVYSVSTQQIAATGTTVDESTGVAATEWQLPEGHYKIVKAGEPFNSRVDFATLWLRSGEATDFVIVVDPESRNFRGAGLVTGELPTGTRIAGVRIALNAGGSLSLNQQSNVVGSTSGMTALASLFGNFSMVFDRNNHFLSVDSDAQLTLVDRPTASIFSTTDSFKASALYAYNINNPYVGPYARGSFKTRVFPGYLYLEEDTAATGIVNITRLDGSTEMITFGGEANADDLRIKLSEPFAPIVLQEELGANLKAASIDLILLKLDVATRLGYAFRQGIMNELLVVVGSDKGTPVNLVEVDDYNTHGPILGANGSVTFARWLFGSAQFGMMMPLASKSRAGDSFADRLLIDFSGTAGLRLPALTSFLYASFEYSFRLERDGFITPETQFDHTLMARLNLSLF